MSRFQGSYRHRANKLHGSTGPRGVAKAYKGTLRQDAIRRDDDTLTERRSIKTAYWAPDGTLRRRSDKMLLAADYDVARRLYPVGLPTRPKATIADVRKVVSQGVQAARTRNRRQVRP